MSWLTQNGFKLVARRRSGVETVVMDPTHTTPSTSSGAVLYVDNEIQVGQGKYHLEVSV